MKSQIFLVFSCIVLAVLAKPYYRGNSDVQRFTDGSRYFSCFEYDCPQETAICKRVVRTSQEKTELVTTVQCFTQNGNQLKSFTTSKANPFDRNVEYSSISFTANTRYDVDADFDQIKTSDTPRYYNYNNKKNEVETFK